MSGQYIWTWGEDLSQVLAEKKVLQYEKQEAAVGLHLLSTDSIINFLSDLTDPTRGTPPHHYIVTFF